jgi:hypothetical protein
MRIDVIVTHKSGETDLAAKYQQILDELGVIRETQEKILMDTTALKTAFGGFSDGFNKFAADFQVFLAKQPAGDTPEQIADVKAVTDGMTALQAQVASMDAAINPPAQ